LAAPVKGGRAPSDPRKARHPRLLSPSSTGAATPLQRRTESDAKGPSCELSAAAGRGGSASGSASASNPESPKPIYPFFFSCFPLCGTWCLCVVGSGANTDMLCGLWRYMVFSVLLLLRPHGLQSTGAGAGRCIDDLHSIALLLRPPSNLNLTYYLPPPTTNIFHLIIKIANIFGPVVDSLKLGR